MKWQVFTNWIGDNAYYRVGRKLRDGEPLHSGNVEYAGDYTTNKDEAIALADRLNEGEQE